MSWQRYQCWAILRFYSTMFLWDRIVVHALSLSNYRVLFSLYCYRFAVVGSAKAMWANVSCCSGIALCYHSHRLTATTGSFYRLPSSPLYYPLFSNPTLLQLHSPSSPSSPHLPYSMTLLHYTLMTLTPIYSFSTLLSHWLIVFLTFIHYQSSLSYVDAIPYCYVIKCYNAMFIAIGWNTPLIVIAVNVL